MDLMQTVKEVFEPTFEAVGDGELNYEQKRSILYNLYCFACAVCPSYVASPCKTLFEYGCCFLLEPERHPDYASNKDAFTHKPGADDVLPGGGRWYKRRGEDKYFIKYDFGSELFKRVALTGVVPKDDLAPIPTVSLYAAVYLCCSMYKALRPLWYTYYFYLDATNEPVDEEYDQKLWELLNNETVYKAALYVRGSMLIGDEAELGAGKLLDFYAPFIAYRRKHIFDVFEERVNAGDHAFVAEYSEELLKLYPENAAFMNWSAAARTELVIKSRDLKELDRLIKDLREYVKTVDSPVVQKYLKLAVTVRNNARLDA